MLLAIDTSNEFAGVALWNEDGLRAEATWYAGRQHTEQVLPQIALLLQHARLSPSALLVVAVATGPGSWSGLRAGISLGKSIAVGLGIPIVGVPTLDALANAYRGPEQVLASVRIGRDRFAIARYVPEATGMRRAGPFESVGGAEVHALHGAVLLGDLAAKVGAQHEEAGSGAVSAVQQCRAAYLAAIAWARHRRSDYDDLVTLEPIYLGNPVRTE
ncbi:MAG TPA: tRNA (adenosine(37)-N6)-threonylcarbamoyltransferase complex dimerization subunit type 1 TsaB [Herpetosiphonaceae bacterium]|nr:tRNA (adenosine(37)-N6)-threonylcarbamoyltransferase complex dimerization subunit type 1 TsaB [Herpetosiphonaceae bacterium]